MTEPYIGEIQLFGFDYNPYGWALCNGATLPVTQNNVLYSLLGVAYGAMAPPRSSCRILSRAPAASRARGLA